MIQLLTRNVKTIFAIHLGIFIDALIVVIKKNGEWYHLLLSYLPIYVPLTILWLICFWVPLAPIKKILYKIYLSYERKDLALIRNLERFNLVMGVGYAAGLAPNLCIKMAFDATTWSSKVKDSFTKVFEKSGSLYESYKVFGGTPNEVLNYFQTGVKTGKIDWMFNESQKVLTQDYYEALFAVFRHAIIAVIIITIVIRTVILL